MMGAIPRQIRACAENNISPLFGIELYVNDMHGVNTEDLSPEEKKLHRKSYHLLAIAVTNEGYSNLVKLSSWAWANGLYYKPRVTHEQLMKHKKGIVFTSCCYLGEIGQAFDRGGSEAAYNMLDVYMKMFEGQFYLEMMLLDFSKQKPYDAWIVEASQKKKLPTIITQDTHYTFKEDSKYQRYMLMVQTKNTIADIEKAMAAGDSEDKFFELQDTNLWMKSEEEINEKWMQDYRDTIPLDIFNQSKKNTVKICHQAKGVQIDKSLKLPQVEDAEEKFKEAVLRGMVYRGLHNKKPYQKRLKEEIDLIKRKGFCSYFLIQKQMISVAKSKCKEIMGFGQPEDAVSPGRGSAASSLVCYCLGITDVDPLKHDLLFSRFLSESRGGNQMKIRFSSLPEELLLAD